jgi:tRNA threonylcarbamoyladenosine biosynthesis protein TsaB
MRLPLPHLLLIDTCGTTGTIALANTAGTIIATANLPNRTASERLIPAIKSLIADHGLTPQSLGAIAVVHGPGSFTGVRIGLSAAKGLCEALAIPLIAISRLAVLASLAPTPTPHIHALLDAGRNEFYHGEYLNNICLHETLQTRDEVLSTTGVPHDHRAERGYRGDTHSTDSHAENNPAIITCDPSVAESLAALNPHLIPEPTAAEALPLALRRIHAQTFDNIATIDANYVRRTDAEIFAKPKPPNPQTQPKT